MSSPHQGRLRMPLVFPRRSYLVILWDAESVTHQIDLAVAALAEQDDSAADAVVVGRRVLADASGDW